MGMFDNVVCKAALPVKRGVMKASEWKSRTYQTKSLDNALFDFEIRPSGLWRRHVEYETKDRVETSGSIFDGMPYLEEVSSRWKREDFTGEVYFYDIVFDVDDSHDLWVEFKARFVDGKLSGKITLEEWRLEENSEKKEQKKKLKEEMEARKEFTDKWYFKYILRHWNATVTWVFRLEGRFHNWWGSARWKLERWLKF